MGETAVEHEGVSPHDYAVHVDVVPCCMVAFYLAYTIYALDGAQYDTQ